MTHQSAPVSTAAGAPRGSTPTKVILGSFVGTALEWYDYFIYGTAAALVFPKLFFPMESGLASTLASFATFAVGFVVRPLGGAVFGHIGDRYGRKRALVLTLLIMGLSTVLVGLLPSYASVGLLAPFLLVILRIVQGLAIGGEWSGAVLLSTENSADSRRGLAGSWPQMGSPGGLLLSTGVFGVVSTVSDGAFLGWAWRIPFVLSVVLLAVGLWIRSQLGETVAFERLKAANAQVRNPIREVIRRHPRNFFLGIFARIGIDTSFYILSVYSLSYAVSALGMRRNTVLIGLVLGAVLGLFTMPLFGHLADKIGPRRVLGFGLVFMFLFAWPFFAMLDSTSTPLVWIALILSYGIGTAAGWSPFAGFMSSLFSPSVRYSGTALSFQLAGVFGGALAPSVAALLLASTGTSTSIALYWAVTCLISLVCTFAIKHTYDEAPASGTQGDERI